MSKEYPRPLRQEQLRKLWDQGIRGPTNAGRGWYELDPDDLSEELEKNLNNVPEAIDGTGLPIPGARVIIAPHAGYYYSGPNAAWAYKSLDLSTAKRIFILGPSHKYGLGGAALSTLQEYHTPFGAFTIDTQTTGQLRATGLFSNIPKQAEIDEHCLEMQLPYLWKRLEQTHGGDETKWPIIVPMLVGDGDRHEERQYGALLAPYLEDPENAFIISSDFCHWGHGYRYRTFFSRDSDSGAPILMHNIVYWEPTDGPIHESIKMLDDLSIDAIKTGVYDNFRDNIDETNNTVCGRHPIGVMMAALEIFRGDDDYDGQPSESTPSGDKGMFKFLKYDRSKEVMTPSDRDPYSVSYVSAYAVI